MAPLPIAGKANWRALSRRNPRHAAIDELCQRGICRICGHRDGMVRRQREKVLQGPVALGRAGSRGIGTLLSPVAKRPSHKLRQGDGG